MEAESITPKETPTISLEDRYTGCLMGLAAGDAVGTTLEFRRPGSFTPIEDMVGGGPFSLKPGQWTDDTSMALCLAESLVTCHGFDAEDQMQRYVRWWREGYWSCTGFCFDIGNTVSSALSRFNATGDPMAGDTSPRTAGNGSLMRLAPVPMAFRSTPKQALEYAAASSRTTHGAATAVDACRYFSGLLIGALNGVAKDTLLSPRYHPTGGAWAAEELSPEIDEIAAGSFKRREPPEIAGTGYVVRSLEAALWAFHRSDSFREGCLMAANLGDDADTTAAIFGQIAGAYYGESGIPSDWREKLAMQEQIRQLALNLMTFGGEG